MKFPKHILYDVCANSVNLTDYHWINEYAVVCKSSENETFFFLRQKNKFLTRIRRTGVTLTLAYKSIFLPRTVEKNLNTVRFQNKKTTALGGSIQSLFDINFLKKEKIYTKLKYSRVPQYDAVSGGVAALFAGFLGFLICEKFGFELPDSGDFYFVFMYFTFFFFILKLLSKTIDNSGCFWTALNFKWLFEYLSSLFIFTFYFFKIVIM